jgi:hypothetical protein
MKLKKSKIKRERCISMGNIMAYQVRVANTAKPAKHSAVKNFVPALSLSKGNYCFIGYNTPQI